MKTMLTIVLTILPYIAVLGQQTKLCGQQEAIALAENFVRINGYCTNSADSNSMVFEMFDEYYPSKKAILERRYNTLQCKAYCITENDKEWHVGFLRAEVNISLLDSATRLSNLPGRSVTVEKDGKAVSMKHKSPLFSHFTKL